MFAVGTNKHFALSLHVIYHAESFRNVIERVRTSSMILNTSTAEAACFRCSDKGSQSCTCEKCKCSLTNVKEIQNNPCLCFTFAHVTLKVGHILYLIYHSTLTIAGCIAITSTRQTSRSKARPVHSRILSCCATTQSRMTDLEISAI